MRISFMRKELRNCGGGVARGMLCEEGGSWGGWRGP